MLWSWPNEYPHVHLPEPTMALVLVFLLHGTRAALPSFGRPSKALKFFSDAAYAAYVIHPLIIVPVTFAFVSIVRKTGREVFDLGDAELVTLADSIDFDARGLFVLVAHDKSDAEGLMWGAFFFISILTELITWPIAHVLCKAPVLNKVL